MTAVSMRYWFLKAVRSPALARGTGSSRQDSGLSNLLHAGAHGGGGGTTSWQQQHRINGACHLMGLRNRL